MAHKVLITDIDTGKVLLDCVSSGYIYAISNDEAEGIRATNYFGDISGFEVAQLVDAVEWTLEGIRERNPDVSEVEKFLRVALESGLAEREYRDAENSYEEAESNE